MFLHLSSNGMCHLAAVEARRQWARDASSIAAGGGSANETGDHNVMSDVYRTHSNLWKRTLRIEILSTHTHIHIVVACGPGAFFFCLFQCVGRGTVNFRLAIYFDFVFARGHSTHTHTQ